jgi:site-specific recombinase XerD
MSRASERQLRESALKASVSLEVQHAELAAFVDELANSTTGKPPLAAATLQRKIACLRSFYRHLHRNRIIERNPASELSNPRLAKRRPHSQGLAYHELPKPSSNSCSTSLPSSSRSAA